MDTKYACVAFWSIGLPAPGGCSVNRDLTATDRETVEAMARTRPAPSAGHGTLPLKRSGDAGRSAYEERLLTDDPGEAVHRSFPRGPRDCRADIPAKGVWRDGRWIIEPTRHA